MMDVYGDARVIFDTGSGIAFTTESKLRGGRMAPTPSTKDDGLNSGGKVAFWGANNDYPQQVVEELRVSDLLRPLIRKQAKRMIGQGLSYGTVEIDPETGDEVRKPMRVPEIDRALRKTNVKLFLYEAWLDWLTHGNVFAELQTDYEGRIVGLYCQDATRCRLSRKDKAQRITNCYISGKWANGGTEKDAATVPAIDPYYDQAGQVINSRSARFIVPIRLLVDDQDYYGQGQWHGLINGGYLELAKAIIKAKLYLSLNLSHMRYHVEIGEEYWEKAYPGFKGKEPDQKQKIKTDTVAAFTKWATGMEKAGRTLMTEMLIDEVSNKKEYRSLWKVTPFKLDIPTGAYIEDSAEVDAKIIRAFMDASLFGATPSKDRNSAGSGSDKMIAHSQEVDDNQVDADLILTPLDIMAEVNGWHEKYGNGQLLQFWFRHPKPPQTRPKQG